MACRTKANGWTTLAMVSAPNGGPKAILTKAIGREIKDMEEASITGTLARPMSELGKIPTCKAKVQRSGLMVLATQELGKITIPTVMELRYGSKEVPSKETGKTAHSMGKGSFGIKKGTSMKENGTKGESTAKGNSGAALALVTKANTSKASDKEEVVSSILMGILGRVSGSKASPKMLGQLFILICVQCWKQGDARGLSPKTFLSMANYCFSVKIVILETNLAIFARDALKFATLITRY